MCMVESLFIDSNTIKTHLSNERINFSSQIADFSNYILMLNLITCSLLPLVNLLFYKTEIDQP